MGVNLHITKTQHLVRVPVTVFAVAGELDGSNYAQFQNEAMEMITAGARYFLLDFSQVYYISSAGLRALHLLAKTLAEMGDAAGVSDMSSGLFKSPFLKLLKPTSAVRAALDVMGFNMSMEIHNDLQGALASF